MKGKQPLCLISFVFIHTLLFAQQGEIVFTRLTKENGLAANLIHAVLKDRQGYYWFSSVNGLQRFDGYRFLNFRHDKKDSTSLPDNTVYQLMEDRQNRLWLNADGYPCIFDRMRRQFKKIPVDYPGNKPFNIYSLFQDSKGLIWMVSGPQGLFVLDTIKNIFRPYTTVWAPFFSKAFHFEEDAESGRYWLATEKGCVVYDTRRKIYLHSKNNPDSLSCFKSKDFSEYCQFIYLDKNKILWTYSGHPLKGALAFRYDITKNEFITVKKNEFVPVKYYTNAEPTKFITDQTGTTWAYGTQLWRYDSRLKEFFEMPHQRNNLYGIFLNWIYNMYEDADGTVWVMSDRGLYNFNPKLQNFTTLNGVWSYRLKKFINAETNGYLQTSDGHILSIGWDNDGIIFYDSTIKQVKPIYGFNPADKKYNHENWYKCWAAFQDSKGIIWIGCQYGGTIQINPVTRQTITLNLPEFEKHTIRSITEDAEGNIWFGTNHSTVVKWVRSTNKFKQIISYAERKEDFGWMHILQGNKGDFWIATSNNGLLHIDMASGKITGQFLHDENNPSGISSNYTKAIIRLNGDTLAIGTEKGIDLFSISKKTFSHISENDGLPGGGIFSMIADDKENLWFTTVDGIAKIHLPDKRIHEYGPVDGVTEKDFQYGAVIRLKDGRIVFGNTRGLVYFNPDDINESAIPSDVTISGFRIFDKNLFVDSLLQGGNKIRLKHSQNYISIQFASLGNIIYNQPVYYYKLEGIDKDWIRAGSNQEAIYTYLPGGHYTFKVKCISPDGIESKNITSFSIYIQPPLYLRWWFIVLALSIIGGVLYYIYLLRLRRRKERELIRNRIARDLHDDMGSVLSTINILSNMTKTKLADDPVKASEYVGKISDNSQRMMEAMSDIVWSIKPANDSMQKITARMREFASGILEAKDIELDFKVDEKVNDVKLNMEARRDFFLIFKEAVNNVAKYSRCNKCSIHISLQQHRLILEVYDNGIGFDINKADSGNGLSNMQKRAEALKGGITIQSKPGEGTQVALNMPLQ